MANARVLRQSVWCLRSSKETGVAGEVSGRGEGRNRQRSDRVEEGVDRRTCGSL